MNELSFIRKNLRSRRRALTQFEQKQAQLNVLHCLNHLPIFHSSKKIGLYLHAFGEIHTDLLIKLCFKKEQTSLFTHDLFNEPTFSMGKNK
ncbi:hypothetical protein I5592_11670 [Acinetobacter baumannii]|nr:hypothetical protein I5592_11670 [Acinetobacter baumannii]